MNRSLRDEVIHRLRLVRAFIVTKVRAAARVVLKEEIQARKNHIRGLDDQLRRARDMQAVLQNRVNILDAELRDVRQQVVHKEWIKLRDEITSTALSANDRTDLFQSAKDGRWDRVKFILDAAQRRGYAALVGLIISNRAQIDVRRRSVRPADVSPMSNKLMRDAGEVGFIEPGEYVTLTLSLKDSISVPVAINPIDVDLVKDFRR